MRNSFNTKQIIWDAYENDYKENLENAKMNEEFETIITLKNENPISFQPRRLSYADKDKLQTI